MALHLSIISTGGTKVSLSVSEVPGLDIWLHNGLVCPMARGGPGGRGSSLPLRISRCLLTRGESFHGDHHGRVPSHSVWDVRKLLWTVTTIWDEIQCFLVFMGWRVCIFFSFFFVLTDSGGELTSPPNRTSHSSMATRHSTIKTTSTLTRSPSAWMLVSTFKRKKSFWSSIPKVRRNKKCLEFSVKIQRQTRRVQYFQFQEHFGPWNQQVPWAKSSRNLMCESMLWPLGQKVAI